MTIPLTTQLLTISIISLQRQIYHNRGMNRTSWNQTYDFVVVGGGTAGSIVACRLTENPNVNVLLLEAGGPLTITSDIVPIASFLEYDWGYQTVPLENAAFGLHEHRIPMLRGKILGGTHTVNMGVYLRGNARDYDSWVSQYGATGWSASEVLPYFMRSENNTDSAVVAAGRSFHGTTGPVQVSTIPNPDPILRHWLNAVTQLGWPMTDFADLAHQYGTGIPQATQSLANRTRQSTAAAFIEVNIGRPNLHLLLRSHVTRILFHGSKAVGVEFVRNNQTYQVSASREVILSAGTSNSAQLLMLSGVGPREHLAQFDIPMVANLPVGSSLFDHPTIPLDVYARNRSDIAWSSSQQNQMTISNLYDYMVNAHGSLTQLPVVETYIASGINGDRAWPDVMMYVQINQNADARVENILPLYDHTNSQEWRRYLNLWLNNDRHVTLAFNLFRPRSSGTIRLRSANPFDAPLIDLALFSNRADLASIVRGASISLKLIESPLMSPYIEYSSIPIPGCTLCTDGRPLSKCYSYLLCVAQTYTITSQHMAGSVPMGNFTNPRAVVDERLRVRTLSNLRVIDASIMPHIPNANINAATMMVGEKGADMVLQDHGLV